MQKADKTASASQTLTSEEYRQARRDELVRRLFQMTVLNEASIQRIVDLVEELYD